MSLFVLVIVCSCRIQHDSDDLTVFGNESGYSSRMEPDNFGESKASSTKKKMNNSVDKSELDIDNFYLFRRTRKPSVEGEDKFNKLSDEIILMILKWLPKKYLVRIMTESVCCNSFYFKLYCT